MTIYFSCPDFVQPSGGTRAIYQQVKYLSQNGFRAIVVHGTPGFRLTWHGIDAPVLSYDDITQLAADDIWVMPEGMLAELDVAMHLPCRKWINALNWHSLTTLTTSREDFLRNGFEGFITPNRYIQEYVRWALQMPCAYLPASINPGLFFNVPKEAGLVRVAYQCRKSNDGHMVRNALVQRYGPQVNIHWHAMCDLDEEAYARTLRTSHIYLATGIYEGLNISVVEAMACDTLVIGYTGGGGADHMIEAGEQQNCFLVDGGNILAFSQVVDSAIAALQVDTDAFRLIRDNGLAMANNYNNPYTEEDALIDFFKQL